MTSRQILITASRHNPLNNKTPMLKKTSVNRRNASQSESKIRPTMGSKQFPQIFLTAARTVPPKIPSRKARRRHVAIALQAAERNRVG